MKNNPEAIKVEEGIPLPEAASRTPKYPWAKMRVGDSFFIACKRAETGVPRSAASVWGKRHNMKFSIHHVDGGVRVWRTA